MATDRNGLVDEVTVRVTSDTGIGDRPADGDAKAKWVDYVTALGMDRDAAKTYTRAELTDLAARFGG